MPLSPRLEIASQNFNMNSNFLKSGLTGFTDEDWLKRPNDHTNHMLWIVGHLIWSRSAVLARLGDQWKLPWMQLYARGEKCTDCPDAPPPALKGDCLAKSSPPRVEPLFRRLEPMCRIGWAGAPAWLSRGRVRGCGRDSRAARGRIARGTAG